MNDLTVFKNEQFGEVRVIEKSGEPWFVAADVCKVLDLSNSRMVLARLDDDEKGVISTDTPGGMQELKADKEQIAELRPKADYFDALVDRNTLTGIRETAKVLGWKQKAFVKYLIVNGYLYRDGKNKLQVYEKHIDGGLFVLKEYCTVFVQG